MLGTFQSVVGLVLILGLSWAVSEERRRFPVKLALGALALQLGLVLLLFGVPQARAGLLALGHGIEALGAATQAGTGFVFGYLAGGAQPFPAADPAEPGAPMIFAFRVLPVILVVCALSALLWHLKLLQWLTRGFGAVFERTLGLRGAPALACGATIFMGQVEGPIFIRAYLAGLSRSELFLLLTVGMSCVSGSTMVAYAAILAPSLPNAAAHVLTASLISAPAGVLLARILVPPGASEREAEPLDGAGKRYDSAIDAVIRGIGDGLAIVLNVAATLIVFVALVALADALIALLPPVAGAPLSIERVLGIALSPLAWAIGIPWAEAGTAGRLLGTKMVLTEFSAFIELGHMPAALISDRSRVILTYALCGFANIASVGINASGFGVLVPERRAEVLGMVWKAMLAGFLATCMTAALVGALPEGLFGG